MQENITKWFGARTFKNLLEISCFCTSRILWSFTTGRKTSLEISTRWLYLHWRYIRLLLVWLCIHFLIEIFCSHQWSKLTIIPNLLEWLPKSFQSRLAKESHVVSVTCKSKIEMLGDNKGIVIYNDTNR